MARDSNTSDDYKAIAQALVTYYNFLRLSEIIGRSTSNEIIKGITAYEEFFSDEEKSRREISGNLAEFKKGRLEGLRSLIFYLHNQYYQNRH